MPTVRARQNDTVDALCWRELGTTDIVTEVYTMNPGLADLGNFLPAGTPVLLPEPSSLTPPALPIIQLWD